jgi:hypothetical protein
LTKVALCQHMFCGGVGSAAISHTLVLIRGFKSGNFGGDCHGSSFAYCRFVSIAFKRDRRWVLVTIRL